jgi:hypothetical protein
MCDRELDDAEGRFSRSLGRIARAVPTALPGVLQGAQTGAVAGPWGAVAGGLMGGASRFKGPAAPPVAGVSPGPPRRAAPAPVVAPVGLGNANPAAAQLLALMQDPRLAQACVALAAGPQGAREVPVAGTSAAPGAFLNLLCWLAQEAAQHAPTGGATPVDGYLRGPDGGYVTDVASPTARARVLLERLQSERAGEAARTEPARVVTAEQWLLDSGLAELEGGEESEADRDADFSDYADDAEDPDDVGDAEGRSRRRYTRPLRRSVRARPGRYRRLVRRMANGVMRTGYVTGVASRAPGAGFVLDPLPSELPGDGPWTDLPGEEPWTEPAGDEPQTDPAGGGPEQWLLDSGLAELVQP